MWKWMLVASLAWCLCLAGCGDAGTPGGNHGDHEGHEDHEGHTDNEGDTDLEADAYPLTTCVVSGEELGSMGDPVVLEHDGQEVRLCCQGCVATFKGDPAKFLAKLSGE